MRRFMLLGCFAFVGCASPGRPPSYEVGIQLTLEDKPTPTQDYKVTMEIKRVIGATAVPAKPPVKP